MAVFIIIVHVIICFAMIAIILLQAGKSGGLSESFGGGAMQNMFGTSSPTVMTKITVICGSVFLLTCLSLAVFSSYKSKSVVERLGDKTQQVPAAPVTAE